MKKIVLVILMVFVTSYAYADFYVYFDKDTEEIQFIVENEKRVRLSSDDKIRLKKETMKGSLKDYELTEAYTDYKLRNGKFIVNTKKISDRVNAEDNEVEEEVQSNLHKITAKDKLINLGFTDDETLVILNK